MQNKQFYCNTQDFLLLCLLPARHINTREDWQGDRGGEVGGAGQHQNTTNVRHELGEKVSINEPTWTQAGHAIVQSSHVFSRFNLKHNQRPTPSMEGVFSGKASNEEEAEKYQRNQSAYNQNGIFFKEAEIF